MIWTVYGLITLAFAAGIAYGFGYYRGVDQTERKLLGKARVDL